MDKFYLEDGLRVSPLNAILREILVNCLTHREFTSSLVAQFIIEKEQMLTLNANRANSGEVITPDNFRPNPKNPLIASFFRNINMAEELGSGFRNLHHYSKIYSGKAPQMIDGDVFRTIVPLDDNYSFDAQIGKAGKELATRDSQSTGYAKRKNALAYCGLECSQLEMAILEYLKTNNTANIAIIAESFNKSRRTIQHAISSLKKKELLIHKGARNNGFWIIKEEN
jgi:ATP-dependent DNA helicase RecG